MAKLIIDTSTWLDLAKPRIEEVLVELEHQVNNKITVLLTCDIIIHGKGFARSHYQYKSTCQERLKNERST